MTVSWVSQTKYITIVCVVIREHFRKLKKNNTNLTISTKIKDFSVNKMSKIL